MRGWNGDAESWVSIFLERESHFSLELWPIRPSVFDGVRRKVVLRGKGNAWAPISWSFDIFREVGVLSYLFYLLFKYLVDG